MYVLFSFLPLWSKIPSGLRWFILQAMDAARLTTAQFILLLAHGLLRTSLCLFPPSSILVRDCSDSSAGEGRPRAEWLQRAGRQVVQAGTTSLGFLLFSLEVQLHWRSPVFSHYRGCNYMGVKVFFQFPKSLPQII